MRTDYILLKPRKLKATADVIRAVKKERKAGVPYRTIARKYKLSFSYVYYLCLTGDEKTEYRQKMSASSKRYYDENRDEIIRKNGIRIKKLREAKRKIIQKKVKQGCFIGRKQNPLSP